MRATPAVLSLLISSCASYGWADRSGPTVVDRAVAVRTIDLDAHAGADSAALTRELVAELRRAGLHGSTWTGAERTRDVVSCDIALVDDHRFGDHAYIRVLTRCRVDGKLVASRHGDAQLALQPSDRTLGRRRATETAARASFTAVAGDLAKHLQE